MTLLSVLSVLTTYHEKYTFSLQIQSFSSASLTPPIPEVPPLGTVAFPSVLGVSTCYFVKNLNIIHAKI